MQLKNYDQKDGKKVWLTADELGEFVESVTDDEHRFAIGLLARSGLRGQEALDVTPDDLVEGPSGKRVRVWHGKGDKYRETPIPTEFFWMGKSLGDRSDEPILSTEHTRTLRRWVSRAADEMFDETDDVGWSFLGPHDLRRSWGTLLIQNDVEPLLVMDWGGWDNFRTFRDHYMDVHSAEFQREEVEKVEWLR